MPLFFLGTREWRNRQTRTVQVRVPVMEWGFNSPLAHDETADPSGSAVFVFPGCGLWPRWCSGRRRARPLCVPVGGGPPARRPRCELRSARRLEARPGPATAHRHRGRSLRRPLHLWGRVTVRQLYASSRSPARPRHRPWEPGYRTKRVGFMVTFRLFGAEKSVLKLVGANLKDGQNVLVL